MKAAGHPREKCAQDERQNLDPGGMNAEGLGHLFILPNGNQPFPQFRPFHPAHEQDHQDHQGKHELVENGPDDMDGFLHGRQPETFHAPEEIDVLHHHVDHESKAHGDHREIRSSKPQAGVPDHKRHGGGDQASRDGRQNRRHRGKGEFVHQEGGGIRSQPEKGYMAKAQVAGESSDDVPALGQNHIQENHVQHGQEIRRRREKGKKGEQNRNADGQIKVGPILLPCLRWLGHYTPVLKRPWGRTRRTTMRRPKVRTLIH